MTLISLNGCATWRSLRVSDPLSPSERLNLGVSYERDGKLDLALREYERAATGGTESIALTYQGNIHSILNDHRMAERTYRAALKVDPDNLIALNNLAWLLAQDGESLDEAESLIRRALARNPASREAYENTLQKILESR